jgi:putative transposase
MPRQSRIDAPGALHHIINRGIERKKIFRDEEDYQNFVNRLSKLIEATGTTCYAWSLMPNHFHLLLQTGHNPISKFMMRLLSGYANTFNRKYKRSGHLFQNRYKSILCQKDNYLKELVRYIHLNPLRAKVVNTIEELNRYPFTGHAALKGHLDNRWQNTDFVLSLFADTLSLARRRYGIFVKEGQTQGRIRELTGGGLIRSYGSWKNVKDLRKTDTFLRSDERMLGDSEFVQAVLEQAKEDENFLKKLKNSGITELKVRSEVSKIFHIEPEKIVSQTKDRTVVQARRLYCFWLVDELGFSMTKVAKILDSSVSTISRSVKIGESISKEKGLQLTKPLK